MVLRDHLQGATVRKAWRFLGRWWSSAVAGPVTALLLGGVGATQGDHYHAFGHSFSWPISLIFAALITAIGGTVDTARQIRTLRSQARNADELSERTKTAEMGLVDIVAEELRNLISSLGLYSNGRANLFMCRDDHFVLVGRSSPSPTFGRSSGRETYPIDSGVLGQAWKDGRAEDGEFPHPGPVNRDEPTKGWLERQERCGIDRAVACRLTMKSCAYAAVRLEHDRQRLGVLVVETTAPGSVTLAALDAEGSSYGTLSGALYHLRDLDEGELRARVLSYLPTR